MDTEGGWARFALLTPTTIDFPAIAAAMHDANYALQGIEIEVAGSVQEGILTLADTGQKIPIQGDAPQGSQIRLKGMVEGWPDGPCNILISAVLSP